MAMIFPVSLKAPLMTLCHFPICKYCIPQSTGDAVQIIVKWDLYSYFTLPSCMYVCIIVVHFAPSQQICKQSSWIVFWGQMIY